MGAGALPGGTDGRYDSPLGRHFHSLSECSAVFPHADILARVDYRTSAGWAFFVIRPRSSPSPSPSRLLGTNPGFPHFRVLAINGQVDWPGGRKISGGKQCDSVNFLLFTHRRLARTGSVVYHFLIDYFWKERVSVSALLQMLYQRSLDIGNRLDSVLQLIRHGGYSTPKLAEKLGVSIPTVSRDVTALRQRGHDIRSTRTDDGWSFVLYQKKPPNTAGETNSRWKEARV